MNWNVHRTTEFRPIKISIELTNMQELVEFYWRMAMSGGELSKGLEGRHNRVTPSINNTVTDLLCITSLRDELLYEIHRQGGHSTIEGHKTRSKNETSC